MQNILRNIGRRVGIDIQYFVKNSTILTFSYALDTIRAFFLSYLVIRLFPAQEYGAYKFINLVLGIVTLVGLPGISTAITQSIAKQGDKKVPILFSLRWQIIICMLGSIVLLCSIPFLHIWNREELWPLFVIAAILFVPKIVVATFYNGILTGKKYFAKSIIVNIWTSVFSIIAVIPLLLWVQKATLLLIITIGIPVITNGILLRRWLSQFPSEKKSWDIIRYGTALSFNSALLSAAFYVDGLLISATFGLERLALFSVVMLAPEFGKAWFKGLMSISFAKQATAKDNKKMQKKLYIVSMLMTVAMSVPVCIYIIIAPWLMPLLFPQYINTDMVHLSQIAIVLLFFQPWAILPQQLTAQGNSTALFIAQLSASVLMIITLILLMPSMELMGVIIARGIFRTVYIGIAIAILLLQKPNIKSHQSK